MKPFTQFITEIRAQMTDKDAMKLLGLEPGFSTDDLKSARRKAAMSAHSDRGGSDEAMAKINNAFDTLIKGSKATAGAEKIYQDFKTRDADDQEKLKALHPVVQGTIAEKLDLPAFQAHFTKIFGEPFAASGGFGDFHTYGGRVLEYTNYNAVFQNNSKTIVMTFSVSVYMNELLRSKALSSPDAFLTMSIWSDILVNRKKIKLTQREYKMAQSSGVLSDPNVLFPADKLAKQTAKSGKSGTLKKADAVLTFKRELGAEMSVQHDGTIYAYVPMGGELKASFYRRTFMGKAMWMSGSVYRKHRTEGHFDTATFWEEPGAMHYLWNGLREVQSRKLDDPKAIVAAINQIVQGWKSKNKE